MHDDVLGVTNASETDFAVDLADSTVAPPAGRSCGGCEETPPYRDLFPA